jgi:ATP/maltotriose-dependent transcriptional regulator MalT
MGVENKTQATLWARREMLGEDVGGYQNLVTSTGITSRELEVIQCLMDGTTDSFDIGSKLTIEYTTVRAHFKSIYRKLDVSSRDEAVTKAFALINSSSNIEHSIELYGSELK